jgi:hypothetical protein
MTSPAGVPGEITGESKEESRREEPEMKWESKKHERVSKTNRR